jgi:hypothetical protein
MVMALSILDIFILAYLKIKPLLRSVKSDKFHGVDLFKSIQFERSNPIL